MSERKNIAILIGFVLSVSLLSTSLMALLLKNYYNRAYMLTLGQLGQKIIENQPEAEQAVLSTLKDYQYSPDIPAEENIIWRYGYRQADYLHFFGRYNGIFVLIGFLAGGILFLVTLIIWHKKEAVRIKTLTDYLEKVNAGSSGVLLQAGEDGFSKLQDEIYKTVTTLYQTRDTALKANINFAENLYNIAHQLKTPITAISLSVQMMKENPSPRYPDQIMKQLSQLTHLEQALLLLSRIDAGTLTLERTQVDVFTVLMLAADNLQELLLKADVSVDIPELDGVAICADMEWTMEAFMNLLKNCMEHTPAGGIIYCCYEQNPLYTQIRIWDTGVGFTKEDIPHLFERFYRGENAKGSGIGIGLAISKAIIERQNGTISADNLPDGGACFEIRFYSH